MPVMSIQGHASLAFATAAAVLTRRPRRIIVVEVDLESRTAQVAMDERVAKMEQEPRIVRVKVDERIAIVMGRARAPAIIFTPD